MDVRESVRVTLNWADGRTASVSSPDVDAIDGEVVELPPVPRLPPPAAAPLVRRRHHVT